MQCQWVRGLAEASRTQRIHHDTMPENVLTMEDTLSEWLQVFHLFRSLFINGSISRDPVLSTFIIPAVIGAHRQTNKMKWPESDDSSAIWFLCIRWSRESFEIVICAIKSPALCFDCGVRRTYTNIILRSSWVITLFCGFFFYCVRMGFLFSTFTHLQQQLSTGECVCNT